MTVSTIAAPAIFNSTGVTSVFPYTFYIFQAAHLTVTVTSPLNVITTLTLSPDQITKDYTVSGVGTATGGSVTLLSNGQAWMSGGVLIAGWTITIVRQVPNTQTTNVRGENRYNPEIHENEYDLLVMADQYMTYVIGQLQALVNVQGWHQFQALATPPANPSSGMIAYYYNGGFYILASTGSPKLLATIP